MLHRLICTLFALALFISPMAVPKTAWAQTIAYVTADEIVPLMPEYISATKQVEDYGKQLQKQLEVRQRETQEYFATVTERTKLGRMSPSEQRHAASELESMQANLRTMAAESEKRLADKEEILVRPLYDKFNAALTAVAQENGYTYIIDRKMLLYVGGGIDATPKVKAKLGL